MSLFGWSIRRDPKIRLSPNVTIRASEWQRQRNDKVLEALIEKRALMRLRYRLHTAGLMTDEIDKAIEAVVPGLARRGGGFI